MGVIARHIQVCPRVELKTLSRFHPPVSQSLSMQLANFNKKPTNIKDLLSEINQVYY
jgi:hypothetical protein